MLASLRWVSVELLGQPMPDLIENEANEWLCPRNIRRRNDQIERGRMVGLNQVGDAPVAARCDRRDGRVAIETKKRHRGGEDAAALVLRFVQNLARRRCDDRVNLWRFLGAEMLGRSHPAQRRG